VLADHAGSGKTLAYLLPLLQVLREEERILGAAATQRNCPRLLVVVPTAELCAQVLRVCRALSRAGLRFRSAAATGGHPLRTQRETLKDGVDVLVGTPGRLAELLEDGCLQLASCHAVVCDEVDVLLGEDHSFADQVAPLRDAAGQATRFVFATATIPEQIYMDLEEVGRAREGLDRICCSCGACAALTWSVHCHHVARASWHSNCPTCRRFLDWWLRWAQACTVRRQASRSSLWIVVAAMRSQRRAVSSARQMHCLLCCRSSGRHAQLSFATRSSRVSLTV
jgi:hypothetical protein